MEDKNIHDIIISLYKDSRTGLSINNTLEKI